MKKYRLNTTISLKHHSLLKKYVEKFGTQQSVLEHALESLENNLNEGLELSPEKELWMRCAESNVACIVEKDFLRALIQTADMEKLQELTDLHNLKEYEIESYFQKPLDECSLKEVMEGLVINFRMCKGFDTVNCTDNDDHYMLNITHSTGLNGSKILKMMNESLFETYGVKTKSTVSKMSFFMKIFKNVG